MIYKWFDERFDLGKFREKFLTKTFPANPLFLLGEVALFSFVTLVITGVFLGLLYEPSSKMTSLFGAMVPSAYASVVKIDLLPMGMIIRRIHHWSAMVMIASARNIRIVCAAVIPAIPFPMITKALSVFIERYLRLF